MTHGRNSETDSGWISCRRVMKEPPAGPFCARAERTMERDLS